MCVDVRMCECIRMREKKSACQKYWIERTRKNSKEWRKRISRSLEPCVHPKNQATSERKKDKKEWDRKKEINKDR